jgi:toxin ParE1/3/4
VTKAYEVRFTQGAEEDLEGLHAYMMEHRSVEQAYGLLDALLEKIESLEQFPERGNIPKELDALGIHEFRQVLLWHYRIFYRIIGQTVMVSIIADGRRDIASLLERRLLSR